MAFGNMFLGSELSKESFASSFRIYKECDMEKLNLNAQILENG